jgi:hypothetical protein
MFMLTAIGTAVVIETEAKTKVALTTNEKFENVGIERINNLKQRKNILNKAIKETLAYDDETWEFITSNQVDEIFPYIMKSNESFDPAFNTKFINYISALDEDKAIDLLYNQILNEKRNTISIYLSTVIKELNLFDYKRTMILLKSLYFVKQKIGLIISNYDKPFYDKNDVENLNSIKDFILNNFKERGKKSIRPKSLLKEEKEIWKCTECGSDSNNDIGELCKNCDRDIYGFSNTEINPKKAVNLIEQKIELINEYLA